MLLLVKSKFEGVKRKNQIELSQLHEYFAFSLSGNESHYGRI